MATTATATTTPAATTAVAPAANKTTLFVSDLPKDIEDIENALYRHFGQVGSIVSTKACRDMHTQRLLGHGYVNFQNQADAEKALKTLNFSEIIPGKPIRVSWSQRDPATRKMGTGNLFIKELDDDVTPRMLFEAFSAIGPVASCKLSLDETGKTRHYGFVHYENPALADKALELSEKEQLLVGGKAVVVEHFKKRTDREKEAQASFTHIYIKNLAPEVKLEQISKLCAKFEGEALKEEPFIQLQAPFNTQFALINMNTHEGATKIIEALHEKEGHELGAKDHKLYCARAQTKKERSAAKTLATQQALIQNSGKNLYVKHLDDTMTDEMLRQLFSPYGTIASCSIARFSESGASKGYGFVVFESKESAANAQRELHNKVIGTRPLYVAVAQNRDARIKMLEQQSRNRVQAASMGMPGSIGGMPPHGMMPHHHHHHHHAHHGLPHHHHHHHHAAMGMYGVPPGMPGAYPPGNWGPNNYPQAGGRGRGGPLGVQGQLPRPPMGGRGGGNNMPRGGAGFPMPGGMPPYPGQFPGQQQQGGHPGQQQGGQHPRGPRPNRGNQNNSNNNNNQNNNNSGATAGLPSLQELSKMTPEEQKNTLGERLFVQVQTIHQPQAAKITGMLLEMDVSEIIHIIENESVLRAKVNEALAVLRDYGVSTAGN